MQPIFDSKANIWTITHLFSSLEIMERAVCSHSLSSEHLLRVYPQSFPHLSWPLVLSTFSSSSLYCQLPLVLFTIFFFLKSWFVFFSPLTSSKKLSLPPAVLLAFWFGRWSFYFQLFWWRFAGSCVCFNTILLSTSCCWITKFANKSGTIVFKLVTHSSVCLCVLWIQYHLSQLKCWLVWHLKIA